MNKQLINRAKEDLGSLPEQLTTTENNEPLVVVVGTPKLLVMPIWQVHPRSTEGRMYKQYIRENPSYNQIYVRRTVGNMLRIAAANLPDNWKLVVMAGHRPVEVQTLLYEYMYNKLAAKKPTLPSEELATTARLYVADPSRKPPSHCCGAAVDVVALNTKTSEPVDFGSPINADSKISHTFSPRIKGRALKNRLILLRAMLGAGFSSINSEWWHFSYGDQNWAAFYKQGHAIYGLKSVGKQ